MFKVEVLEEFTLGRFNELKNIQRKAREEKGKLFVGDIFECDQEMVDYLLKDNALKRAFVRVIEIIPEKKISKVIDEEIKKETKKPKSVRKTIAKK